MKTWQKIILTICCLIAILLGMFLLSVNRSHGPSPDVLKIYDVNLMTAALQLYFNDFKQYPANLDALVPDYLGEVPKPRPSDKDSVCKKAEDTVYRYERISNERFNLYFCLSSHIAGYSPGGHILTEKGIQ